MRRDTRIAAAVFLPVPAVILAAAAICTWAVANGAAERWRLLFRILCHGIPSRCFVIWGVPMPICARCTAIYIGLFAGLLLFCLVPSMREAWTRAALFAAAAIMALDGGTQAFGLRESTNDLRLATGLAFGAALGAWALSAIEQQRVSGTERADGSTS